MEEMRALGELLKQGWKPKRTIIYCFWDGEEPGLLGSTEWAETHAEELQQHAVVYINSDGNGRGFLSRLRIAHAREFRERRHEDIEDPETKTRCGSARRQRRDSRAPRRTETRSCVRVPDLRIGALGSGSDYTRVHRSPGDRVAEPGFRRRRQRRRSLSLRSTTISTGTRIFRDTDFVYGRALAQTAGTAVMRLADADVLPFQFGDFADTVRTYTRRVEEARKRTSGARSRSTIARSTRAFHGDRRSARKSVPPSKEPVPSPLNFAPLESAVAAFSESAQNYDSARSKAAPAEC